MVISFNFMYEKASLGISFIFLLTKTGHEKQIIITNNHRTRLKPITQPIEELVRIIIIIQDMK